MDNLRGENMAGNTTTQHESLDRRDNTEPDVSNIELKQFILEMKQEIMNKLAENQHEIREMKDELRAVKTTVSDVEKATSNLYVPPCIHLFPHARADTIQVLEHEHNFSKFDQLTISFLVP